MEVGKDIDGYCSRPSKNIKEILLYMGNCRLVSFVRADYNMGKLDMINMKKIIRLYGVPILIVPDWGTNLTSNM